MAVGKIFNVEKGGINITFPVIFRLLGRISTGNKGKMIEILGKKVKV